MNPFRKPILFSLISMAFTPSLVLAEPTELDSVVVSAIRSEQSNVTTPGNITVITRDDIEASGATHLVDIIRGRGGVQVRDFFGDGTRATIGMRGFSGDTASSNTLILVDGRRLNNPDTSGPDLNGISIDNIERIEIVQGSAGTLFGDQAVAGVINIITRDIKDFSASVRLDAGSYDTTRLSANLAHRASNGIGFKLHLENRNSDGYRDNNELDYENIFGKVDYKHRQGNVFLEHQKVYEDLNTPGAITDAQVEDDRRQSNGRNESNDRDTAVTRFGVRQSISDNWDFEGELTRRTSDNSSFFGTVFGTTDSRLELKEFTPRFIGFIPVSHGELQLTIGADIIKSEYDIASIFGTTSNKQKVTNYYGQVVIPVTEKISVTTGLRSSKVENDLVDSTAFASGVDINDSQTAAEIGISYAYNAQVRLFARADENFRFAKVNEQTFTDPAVVGLDTQEGVSYEMGAEWKNNRASVKATLYRIKLDNEIDFNPVATGPFSPFFDGANTNLEPTTRNGLTLEGTYQVNKKLNLSGQYSYIDAKFSNGTFDGNEIPFAAKNSALVTANYSVTPAWTVFGEVQYIGDRVQAGDFANSNDKLKGRTITNLVTHYRYRKFTLSGRLNNVFDKEYSDYATFNGFYPAPERNLTVSLQYKY